MTEIIQGLSPYYMMQQDLIINEPIKILGKDYNMTCVSMGNPHCVIFVDDVKGLDIEKIGPVFEKNEIFQCVNGISSIDVYSCWLWRFICGG